MLNIWDFLGKIFAWTENVCTFASAFGLQPEATKKEFFEKLRYRDKEK